MAQNGKNIIVQRLDGATWTAIAAARTDEIEVDGELMEIASRTQAGWREYLAGRKTWSVQTGYLVTQVSNIREVLQVNTRVRLRIGGTGTGEYLTGYAWVKKQKLTAPNGGLANGTVVFQGDGPLE